MIVDLFISFLQVGLFSFGGGYAALPLIRHQIVNVHQWLSISEFTNLITISQITPGPIAINTATFVGTKMAGIPGAIAATLGYIMPSCILVTALAWIYLKYRSLAVFQTVLKILRPVVIALIAAAGALLLISAFFGEKQAVSFSNIHLEMVFIFMMCMWLLLYKKMNPVIVMVISGLANVVWAILMMYVI